MNIFLYIGGYVFISAIGIYFLIRNELVFKTRTNFIDESNGDFSAYKALLSYEAMVLAPRYQLLWTKAQWVAWVKAQGVAA